MAGVRMTFHTAKKEGKGKERFIAVYWVRAPFPKSGATLIQFIGLSKKKKNKERRHHRTQKKNGSRVSVV